MDKDKKKKKLLIADDEENILILYKLEFEEDGYEVVTAPSALEALKLLDREKPDLLIMDICMPEMDGIEALGKILSKNNKLPVILNSAYSSYKDNFMSWCANAYVVKSSDLTELKETVIRVLKETEKA